MMRKVLIAAALLAMVMFVVGCATTTDDTNQTTDTSTEESQDSSTDNFTLTSSAFTDGTPLPLKYANEGITGGQNISVPLAWTNVPDETISFVLVCIDRDASDRIHWAVINIPAAIRMFSEGGTIKTVPQTGATELKNTSGNARYDGPRPPAGGGIHRYEFTIYALNAGTVSMPDQPTAAQFEAAVKPVTLGMARITGTFENK